MNTEKPPVEWQSRVREERAQVNERLERLNDFMLLGNSAFKGLPQEDKDLLWHQRSVMADYVSTLDKRIARFT